MSARILDSYLFGSLDHPTVYMGKFNSGVGLSSLLQGTISPEASMATCTCCFFALNPCCFHTEVTTRKSLGPEANQKARECDQIRTQVVNPWGPNPYLNTHPCARGLGVNPCALCRAPVPEVPFHIIFFPAESPGSLTKLWGDSSSGGFQGLRGNL